MFVNLHNHGQFSAYDGYNTSKNIAKHVNEIGQEAIALTDHGNVAGVLEHYYACKEIGVKPILGVEAYFVPKFKPNEKQTSYHLVLLAKNNKGYKNLMRIISAANEQNFYYKPHVDFKLLKKYSAGIICLTACGSGLIPRLLVDGKKGLAKKAINKFLNIFGDDFYLEVMAHKMANQQQVNREIIKVGDEMGLPIVVTLDSHYTKKDDFDTHKIMVSMKNDGFEGYIDAHIASEKEVLSMWKQNHSVGDIKEYIRNSKRIADKCDVNIEFDNLMPRLGEDSEKKLRKIAITRLKGLKKVDERYKKRLKREIEVVVDKGYVDYFLICYDIITYAKNNGIAMDFGRGSVGGSLLAYALGITEVDPLVHKTLFERFLRPHRTTLPDIDMDFDSRRRDEIIKYISEKFPNGTAQIISYGRWQIKNTIGDLCKIYGYSEEVKKEVVNKIFELVGDDADEIIYDEIIADSVIKNIEEASGGMITHFCKLYGQISYFGTHASGVAIVDGNIRDYVGLMKSHNKLVTPFDKNALDKLNVLKLDILGLETATVLGIVESLTGVKYSDSILNDKKTIMSFKRAETVGIFQFENRGGKAVLSRVQPDNFQELVACTAMNRPAPLKLGVVDNYVAGKEGEIEKTPWYKFTKDTYGQIIYQEQVMVICRKVANMEWADIDKVLKDLKSTSDKDLKRKFVKGAMKNGYKKEDAKRLYENMTLYLFNRAHGTAYTLVSFYAMWLLNNYPLEYIFAILSREADELKRRLYESLAISKGIIVLLPHVNGSASYSIQNIDGQRVIQSGLSSIKGVGLKTAEEICSMGPFKCEEHVAQRVPKRIFNSRIRSILLDQGALEFDQDLYEKRCARYNSVLFFEFDRLSD